MITRVMLSLKKAANSQGHEWSLGEPTAHTTIRFAERQGGVSTGDGMYLDTSASIHEETKSQE